MTIYIEVTQSLQGFVAMQASASAVQRAGVNKSFTGMGSRAGSTAKLPISRTASGSVLDKRQEHDTGMIIRVLSSTLMRIHQHCSSDCALAPLSAKQDRTLSTAVILHSKECPA